VSPAENATYTNRLVPFEFKAEGALGCSYILDSENETDAECETRESLNLDAGEHVIEVIANNSIGEERESRTFEVVSSRRFAVDYNSFYGKGDTTDLDELSDTDLAVLKNFTLENKYGKIEFLETIDLKEAANVMTDVINIDSNILIGNNSVEVKSDVVSSFNKKARVSLKDLTLDDPRILKDEEVCYDPECEIESYFNGTLVFMVKGFTVYMAEETPDTPDNETEGECFDDIDCSFGEICNDDNECVVSVEPPEPPVPPEPPEPGVECVFDIDCDSGKICNEDSECVEEEKPVNTRFIILIVVLIVVMLIIVGLIIYVVKKQDGGSSRQSEEHSRRGKRDNGGGGRGNGSFSGSNFVIKAKPASGRRGPTPSTHR
jgi:hypothetical protein